MTIQPSPALDRVYRATRYEILTNPKPITYGVGEPCAGVDELLTHHRSLAHITAWNPGSNPLTVGENRVRATLLEGLVQNLGFPYLAGRAGVGDPQWEEEGIVIFGISRPKALLLGALFEQNAIVYAERFTPPQIIWCYSMQQAVDA